MPWLNPISREGRGRKIGQIERDHHSGAGRKRGGKHMAVVRIREPSYDYAYLDVPVSPGSRRCDGYRIELDGYADVVVLLNEPQAG